MRQEKRIKGDSSTLARNSYSHVRTKQARLANPKHSSVLLRSHAKT